MSKTLCIYHGNCTDGFGAAWVVREAFKEADNLSGVEFHPGVYGQEPPNVAGRDVIIVDFSYKRPVIDLMLEVCNSLLIIDHHKTAAEDLKDINSPLATVVFDMTKSGALLTWLYFFPSRPVLELIQTISDRDLWKFERPKTREIQANLFSYPYDFDTWSGLMALAESAAGRQSLATAGDAIERKHHKDIAELVAVTKRWMCIDNAIIPVANLPYTLSSDAGHLMCEQHPDNGFAACYWDLPDHKVQFSLRSLEDGTDVSAVAKKYGGGGHAHAAGFTISREEVKQLFEVWNDTITKEQRANATDRGSNT